MMGTVREGEGETRRGGDHDVTAKDQTAARGGDFDFRAGDGARQPGGDAGDRSRARGGSGAPGEGRRPKAPGGRGWTEGKPRCRKRLLTLRGIVYDTSERKG
jgi:hypothetical protein